MSMAALHVASTNVQLETVSACPICASHHCASLFKSHDWIYELPGEFKLSRCEECGAVYLSERPTKESLAFYYSDDSYYAYQPPAASALFWRQDKLSSIWYAIKKSILTHKYNYQHFGGSRLVALLAHTLLRERATFQLSVLLHPYVENGSLLEIGCGTGRYLDLMKALGWNRVVGVDISSKAVEQARDILGLEVYCGELNGVDLDPNSFDAVSLSHTLEHIADPTQFLRDVHRVMKPGGRLAIIVPNVEGLASRVFREYWLGLESPRHLINFTHRSLSTVIERAGFAIQKITTTPRGGYQVALFSHSRKAGDPHSVYADDKAGFPLHRHIRAFALSLIERAQCAVGLPAGEELVAVAVKPR